MGVSPLFYRKRFRADCRKVMLVNRLRIVANYVKISTGFEGE